MRACFLQTGALHIVHLSLVREGLGLCSEASLRQEKHCLLLVALLVFLYVVSYCVVSISKLSCKT